MPAGRRAAVGLISLMLTLATAPTLAHGSASRSAAALPAGTVAVSPASGPAAEDVQTFLLAGSPSYVVYSRNGYFAKAANGTVTALAATPPGISTIFLENWYTDADLVVATTGGDQLAWWDITAATSGSATLPSGAVFLGATSTGWAYLLAKQVIEETTSGVTTSLGPSLSGTADSDASGGATGPDGVLVTDLKGAATYLPYDDPTHPVTLATATPPDIADPSMSCSLIATAAFCAFSDLGGTSGGERLDLTGKPPVTYSQQISSFAIDATSTVLQHGSTLTITDASGANPSTHTHTGINDVASALDGIVGQDSAYSQVDTISTPSATAQVLVTPVPQQIQATADSTTSGRVVWEGDEPSPDGAKPPYAWSRSVVNRDGKLVLGRPTYLGSMHYGGNVVRASGATTVFGVHSSDLQERQKIETPLRSRTYDGDPEDGGVIDVASGDRVLISGVGVMDIPSGAVVQKDPGAELAETLWGDYVVYDGSNDSIVRTNLVSGKTTRLAAGKAAWANRERKVYEYGNDVAWGFSDASTDLINVNHPHRVTTIPSKYAVVSLTSDGVLLDKGSHYYLRGYAHDAKPVELVAKGQHLSTSATDVQINQSVLTWEQDGVVRAAPLPLVPDRPRYLGDPIAPKHATPTPAAPWRAQFPFSASLTKCSVVIRRGSIVVRRVACRPTDAAYGTAVVSWNGQDAKGHRVSAGTLTWRVSASNHWGTVLAANGSTKPVRGTLTIR